MAMPRPSGKAQVIAEMVVPGLRDSRKSRRRGKNSSSSVLSEVEIKQTRNIENKDGLDDKKKTRL